MAHCTINDPAARLPSILAGDPEDDEDEEEEKKSCDDEDDDDDDEEEEETWRVLAPYREARITRARTPR